MEEHVVKDPEGYIELKFGPRWKYIAVARGFIQNFLAISLTTNSKADQIAMAASELLENAVKYASGDETQISMSVAPENEEIHISVSNNATKESIATLKELFEKISKGDPLEAYVAMMKEAAVREDGKSQLGLARIRYETGAAMKLDVSADNKVTLSLYTKKS